MNQAVKVILGPTYQPSLWDLRKRVAGARKAQEPLVLISISAPINSEVIEVAIESGSLYLIGIRPPGGPWLEFAPDAEQPSTGARSDDRPRVSPSSRWIMAGALRALSSYRALRLGWMIREAPGAVNAITYAEDPGSLLRFFARWDGQVGHFRARLCICVLIFVICESLRFRSIENVCARWIRPIGDRPEPLTITSDMLDLAQNWRASAKAGDSDVWTWPPDMPDAIIT